eukprot:2539701-Amphidinium_carterae.1
MTASWIGNVVADRMATSSRRCWRCLVRCPSIGGPRNSHKGGYTQLAPITLNHACIRSCGICLTH